MGDALFWESDLTSVPEELELDPTPLVPLASEVARESIEAELAPWCHSLERKLNRDQRRLTDYYQTIIQEIHHKCQKKK